MEIDKLNAVLASHLKWLSNVGGSRADLRGADLGGAVLTGADLRGANLRGANLRRANLRDADLRGADLARADLGGTDLRGADLGDADLKKLKSERSILPEGDLIGYKKLADGTICKLLIPANSKRVNGICGRKCRAEYVKVLEGEGISKNPSGNGQILTYKIGEIVRCVKPFNDDIREECTSGIHFFITKEEAEAFS